MIRYVPIYFLGTYIIKNICKKFIDNNIIMEHLIRFSLYYNSIVLIHINSKTVWNKFIIQIYIPT